MMRTKFLNLRVKIMKNEKLSKYDIITLSKWFSNNTKIEYLSNIHSYEDCDSYSTLDFINGLESYYTDGLDLLKDMYNSKFDKYIAFKVSSYRYGDNYLKLLTVTDINKLFIENIHNELDYWINQYLEATDYFEYTFQDRLAKIKGYYPNLIGDYQERKANEVQNRYCECEIEYY